MLGFLFFNPGLSGSQQLAYIAVTYVLWGLTYTLMDIPYWSMVPALTDDEKERDVISVIPRIFASVAWMVIGYGGLHLVKWLGENDGAASGFGRLGVIVAVVFVICSLITFHFVRDTAPSRPQVERKRISPREMIRVLVKNDQVIVVLVLALFFNISFQLSNGFAVFYCKYVIGDEYYLSCYVLASGIAQLIGLFGYPVSAALIGRRLVFTASAIFPVAGFAILLLNIFPADKQLLWWTLFFTSAIINLGIGLSLGILTVMLADVVDYGEYKLGSRNESIIFSTQTFVVKFAGALSGFISGTGLTIVGFVANTRQTPEAELGIRVIMGGVPLLFSLLYLGIYWRFYRLNGDFLRKIKGYIAAGANSCPPPETAH